MRHFCQGTAEPKSPLRLSPSSGSYIDHAGCAGRVGCKSPNGVVARTRKNRLVAANKHIVLVGLPGRARERDVAFVSGVLSIFRTTPHLEAIVNSQRRFRNASHRRGAAVVELAICLPVIVILMLATMEACTMLYVQQKLKTTAFEGARVGIIPDAKAENVSYQCQLLLDGGGVSGYSVTLDPADPRTLNQGDYLTVTVSAPFAANSLAGGWLYEDKTLSRSVALQAE